MLCWAPGAMPRIQSWRRSHVCFESAHGLRISQLRSHSYPRATKKGAGQNFREFVNSVRHVMQGFLYMWIFLGRGFITFIGFVKHP